MRPDDRSGRWQPVGSGANGFDGSGPLDADLESLDAELEEAGAQARRMLQGQTQPTRFFANGLRDRLIAAFPAAGAAAGAAASPGAVSPGHGRRSGVRPELSTPGEAWRPVALQPQIARRTPTVLPRARWALLAAATLTGVIAAGALGARFDWLLPAPTANPTAPVAVVDATSGPTPTATEMVVTVPTADPTAGPAATDPATTPKPTAKPTPRPTPKPAPTPKPDPTKPPIGPMDLAAKACPGGVILDWTKPSTLVGHYHSLRGLDGGVPPVYPGDGVVEVDTATAWGAGTTDAFDVTEAGGQSATYRTFAFDGADEVLAYSPARTVTTIGAIDLGALTVENLGPGSMHVGWAAADVNLACFTYGKLVASEEDPDPSYLKGSTYLAVVDSPGTTGVQLDGLPSGKTVWMRYEIIRATSTGKFVVARTNVVQVTIP